MKPLILTLTGPTCAGKSTLEDLLIEQGFGAAISTTTRPQRITEKDGEDYYFVGDQTFKDMEGAEMFVESVMFNGNRYGMTRNEVERITAQGKPVIVVCEPLGRDQIARFCVENDWICGQVFVGATPEVIAERFLSRFLDDTAGLAWREQKMKEYTKRLALIMTMERGWVTEAYSSVSPYNYTVADFNEHSQNQVIRDLVGVAQDYGFLKNAA